MHPTDNPGNPAGRSTTAAGWYPDPSGAPVQRYWDGTVWTAHTASGPAPSAGKRSWRPWVIAAVCALLLVALLVVWSMRPSRQGQPGQPGQTSHRTAAMLYLDAGAPAPGLSKLNLS